MNVSKLVNLLFCTYLFSDNFLDGDSAPTRATAYEFSNDSAFFGQAGNRPVHIKNLLLEALIGEF